MRGGGKEVVCGIHRSHEQVVGRLNLVFIESLGMTLRTGSWGTEQVQKVHGQPTTLRLQRHAQSQKCFKVRVVDGGDVY